MLIKLKDLKKIKIQLMNSNIRSHKNLNDKSSRELCRRKNTAFSNKCECPVVNTANAWKNFTFAKRRCATSRSVWLNLFEKDLK